METCLVNYTGTALLVRFIISSFFTEMACYIEKWKWSGNYFLLQSLDQQEFYFIFTYY